MDCSLPGSSIHGIFQARVLLRCFLFFFFYHFGIKTFKFWKCCYWVHHTCVTAVYLGSPFSDAQIAKSEADAQGLFRVLLLWDVGPLLPSAAPWGNCTHFFFFSDNKDGKYCPLPTSLSCPPLLIRTQFCSEQGIWRCYWHLKRKIKVISFAKFLWKLPERGCILQGSKSTKCMITTATVFTLTFKKIILFIHLFWLHWVLVAVWAFFWLWRVGATL